jgi:AbrB family looped-hinge helix DNA binding protein
MKSTVGEKGQVTIPKTLRDRLGLKPGAELEFEERDGKLIGRRVLRADPLHDLLGILPQMDVDAALEQLRGPSWRAGLDNKRRGQRRR